MSFPFGWWRSGKRPRVASNIVTNGDFEANITGWSAHISGTPSWSTVRAHAGSGSLRLVQTAGTQFGVQATVTAAPSTVYTARFWVYTVTAQTIAASLSDGIDQSLSSSNTYSHTGSGWEQATLNFVATDAHTARTLAIFNTVALVGGEEWWIDEVRLTA